jgi:hypothetical protein
MALVTTFYVRLTDAVPPNDLLTQGGAGTGYLGSVMVSGTPGPRQGDAIRLTGSGIATNSVAGTATPPLLLKTQGTVILLGLVIQVPGNVRNAPVTFEGLITLRRVGETGTAECAGTSWLSVNGTTSLAVTRNPNVNVDTTNISLSLIADLPANVSFTMEQCVLEYLPNPGGASSSSSSSSSGG